MQAGLVAPLLFWIVLTPLFGAAFNAWMGPRLPRLLVALVANLTLPIALGLALISWCGAPDGTTHLVSGRYAWLTLEAFSLDVQLSLDALSMTMVLIICGVGSLIHVFSASYMAHDPGFARYFAYLNFFCAMMLLLVLADALPVMFIGWEGVGLASYLLIGFHHHETFRVAAAQKAFVVNRIGDAGLLIAMFVLMTATGTLSFVGLRAAAGQGAIGELCATVACLLVGLAVAGKSAQMPLFVWLPDAMAGPTPVSALIHAATMVTAGVYLLARLSFLLAMSPLAMMVIAGAAAATTLVAAVCALVQHDIKRVLAYSTVSQLGYMVMAAAVGAAPLALFHVTTHAFFKACLFLCAAALIHAQAGEQDMRNMGGLARRMPLVTLCFGVCTLAIAGVPPLSGFVSKDAILGHLAALAVDPHTSLWPVAPWLWLVATVSAGLTALYMGRAFCLTFLSGPYRGPAERAQHLHDAPFWMALPLSVLAALAVSGGVLGWPHVLGGEAKLVAWLTPATDVGALPHPALLSVPQEGALMGLSSALAIAGLGWAWLAYGRGLRACVLVAPPGWRVQLAASSGLDALYELWFVRPYKRLARGLLPKTFEQGIVFGLPRFGARLTHGAGFCGQLLHSGNVQRGAAVLVLSAAVLLYGWLLPAQTLSGSNFGRILRPAVTDTPGSP